MSHIASIIEIKKDDVLNKFSGKIRAVFSILYNLKDDGIIEKHNLRKCSFTLSTFYDKKVKKLDNKTGIYVILDNNVPLYVGIGGRIVNGEQSLYQRLSQHSINKDGSIPLDNASKFYKFKEIDTLLGVKIDKKYEQWYSKLDVIGVSIGDIDNDTDVEFAKSVEKILIATLRPKYNG